MYMYVLTNVCLCLNHTVCRAHLYICLYVLYIFSLCTMYTNHVNVWLYDDYCVFLIIIIMIWLTEKKKKYSGGGMKYTAMAMANRAT